MLPFAFYFTLNTHFSLLVFSLLEHPTSANVTFFLSALISSNTACFHSGNNQRLPYIFWNYNVGQISGERLHIGRKPIIWDMFSIGCLVPVLVPFLTAMQTFRSSQMVFETERNGRRECESEILVVLGKHTLQSDSWLVVEVWFSHLDLSSLSWHDVQCKVEQFGIDIGWTSDSPPEFGWVQE